MSQAELEAAVAELVDRQAILDCLMRYSRGVDRLDRELILSAYHPDAIDDHGMFAGMNRTGPPLMVSGGRYIDRFEKRDGVWAIADRLCIRDWAPVPETPDPEDPSTLTAIRSALPPAVLDFMRTAPLSRRDRDDPSYQRPLAVDPVRVRSGRALNRSRHLSD